MHSKSQVTQHFLHFEAMVERHFNTKIKQLQSDRGIELKSLKTYIFKEDILEEYLVIIHPLKMELLKEKNYHVVVTGLSILIRSNVPMVYWEYSVKTIIHLLYLYN